ncbi:efflux transporter outer membrane subunit [Pseudomonas sessilinigenes]|uniref:TolC family protein n=1 Tax=Pseudomonas sessilinigenes TaxID=658629 RepID=A0ABX8MGU3_9PSED|nr:TolC family protein [Pseudomonas sessilinigenes]AZC27692.1 Outer membrane component of tripartite multidrug resistance system [Pseudomonas sessilinigenes]QXH38422.1 TolC family protein [Pseudomonas sessilinigenes]
MPIYRGPALALCIFLGACSVGPQRAPSTTLSLPADPSPAREPGSDQWWRLYQDPALNAAVEEALSHNRDLRAAAANLLQARALLREADTLDQPQTQLSANAGYGSTADDQLEAALGDNRRIRTGTRYGIGLDVQWEMDLFGRLHGLEQAARADADAARAAEDGLRVVVAAETTRAWLQACSYGQRLDVARQSLALVEQGRDLTAELHRSGAALPLDVARAEGLVGQVRAAVPSLEAGRQRALAELAVLLGRLPGDVPARAQACRQPPALIASLPGDDALAMLRRRPDVSQAERRLAAATARIGVARAELYPRISLGAGIASSAHHPDGFDERDASVWRLGPLLSWSFPNISAVRARIAQADARESAALAEFDRSILVALKEQRQALSDYQAAGQRQQDLQLAAERNHEALRLAGLARAAGASSALDYLDAQRTDVASRSAAARADGQLIDAQVLVFKAFGGGWRNAPPVILPTVDRDSHASSFRSSSSQATGESLQ